MTLQEENKMLRVICQIQQRAIRHYGNYIQFPEDDHRNEWASMGAANASNARQMCDLLAIPPGDAPNRDHKDVL